MNNNVIVVGTISCGKSTFLNCVLQKNYFKVGDGVTTRHKLQFKLENLQVTDLPGLNESGENNLYLYKEDIEKALAVFFIFDKTTIKTDSTELILQCVLDCRKDLKDKNVFYILNKIDDVKDVDLLLADIVGQVNESDKSHDLHPICKEDIIPISARDALTCIMFKNNCENKEQREYIMRDKFGRGFEDHDRKEITNDDLNNIYKESNFVLIKNIIEKFNSISICHHIVSNNNHIPYNILVDGHKKYNKCNAKIRKKFVKRTSLASTALVIVGVPLFLMGGAAFGVGGIGFTLYGAYGALTYAVGVGAIAGAVTGLISIIGSRFMGEYKFGNHIESRQVSEEEMNNIKRYLKGKYKKSLKNIEPHFNNNYTQNTEFEDKTFFEKDDDIYMVEGVFIKDNKKFELIKTNKIIRLFIGGLNLDSDDESDNSSDTDTYDSTADNSTGNNSDSDNDVGQEVTKAVETTEVADTDSHCDFGTFKDSASGFEKQ
jgi:GTPase Era involved in 16S rRNA processing